MAVIGKGFFLNDRGMLDWASMSTDRTPTSLSVEEAAVCASMEIGEALRAIAEALQAIAEKADRGA